MNFEDSIKYAMPMLESYPNMSVTQLGRVVLYIGSIRSCMGHEDAESTIRDYIHKEILPADIVQCLDFLEREVLALKKSRVDIDYWKVGNKGEFRSN